MMDEREPISEDDLNAYIDGRLSSARQEDVRRYLGRNPDEAARIADHMRHADALRAALAPLADRPIPSELHLMRLAASRRRRSDRLRRIAASVVLVGAGLAGGWFGHARMESGTVAVLGQETAATYALLSQGDAPTLTYAAADPQALVDWASTALRRPMRVPDLSGSGFRFLGGQVVPTAQGPAMAAIYENELGDRLVFQARPMRAPGGTKMTPYRSAEGGGLVWERNDMGYSLFGNAPEQVSRDVANNIRDALT